MNKHRVAISIIGGICALALAAAATPASAAVVFLAHDGSGSACTLAAPCGLMGIAVIVAGANGEIICLDKGPYNAANISQSVTISCGDGLWEAPNVLIFINTP